MKLAQEIKVIHEQTVTDFNTAVNQAIKAGFFVDVDSIGVAGRESSIDNSTSYFVVAFKP